MPRALVRIVTVAACVVPQIVVLCGRSPAVLAIDAAHSQILIEVGKAGMFGFAGHAHEVAATDVHGRVTLDPTDLQHASVWLEFPSAALRVTGKGESPADVADVQKVMAGDQVLDVTRFPTIVFSSRRVLVTARAAGTADVAIEGDMTLHGATRSMTIRASVVLDAGGRLTARGSFVLKQTDFGMVPVTAMGGTIRVKDELEVEFVLSTRPSDETGTPQ
jgi:polyisoprenoid-binding protein YceI